MADPAPHIEKAKRNLEFARKGIKGDYVDWIVVAEFYSAIHYIEATLARLGKHSDSHTQRYQMMIENSRNFTRDCLTNYKTLESLSRKARYTADQIDDDEATQAQECFETICVELGYPYT
mgnify:CR=1 FL=1